MSTALTFYSLEQSTVSVILENLFCVIKAEHKGSVQHFSPKSPRNSQSNVHRRATTHSLLSAVAPECLIATIYFVSV